VSGLDPDLVALSAKIPIKTQVKGPRMVQGGGVIQVSRPAPGGRTVVREDWAVVTCCARVRRGGIIIGVRRGRPRKDLGALSL